MLGFRLSSPGPFWFEDLVYFVVDEGRRLPARVAGAAAHANRAIEDARRAVQSRFAPRVIETETVEAVPTVRKIQHAELLDQPLEWALATEPLAAATAGANTALALHNHAAEQLGAITYAIDRMRDELRPLLRDASLDSTEILDLDAARETSLEALLELARSNMATRPKSRTLAAA